MDKGREARRGRKTKWRAHKLNLAIACLTAALGMLAAGAGEASAAGYEYVCGTPTVAFCEGSNFSNAFGLGVDNSNNAETAGDVYVANLNGFISRFTANGARAPFTGTNANISGSNLGGFTEAVSTAVGPTGDFYVTDRAAGANAVDKFTPTGEPEPSGSFVIAGFTEITAIAVDSSSGDIWVTDNATKAVDKFSPTGTMLVEISGGAHPNGNPFSIAVDATGHVYVANFGENVQKFNESGTWEAVLNNSSPQSVAIDPSTGNIFVDEAGGTKIQSYKANGEPLASFGEPPALGGFSAGLGVNGVTHSLFVTNIGGGGALFGSGVAPEAPVTEGTTGVAGTTATLHGTVNPSNAGEVEYHFAYNAGLSCEGGSTTASKPTNPTNAKEVPVSTEVTGLLPKTTYTVCLVATNLFGATTGGLPDTFETTAAKPAIENEIVEEITTTTVKVGAQINPGGAATTCEVQYGTTTGYGSTAPCSVAGTGIVAEPVSAELTGLTANTEYHFRFVATNVEGTTEGNDVVVKTKPLVECTTGEANPVGSETAMLHGKVKTGEEAATYYFEYGETNAYGSTTEVKEIPAGAEGEHAVNIEATGLAPGTPYHYQIVCSPASEPLLKLTGGDGELTTLLAKPVIEEVFCENENRHSLSFGAEINPKNSATGYFFEYAKPGEAYEKTPEGTIAKGLATVEVGPESVTELDPGTTYHFRLVATNGAGTVVGPEETCSTTAPKPAIVEAESSAQVTQTTATINAAVNPNGLQSIYTLEIGTDTNYGTPTFGELGSGTEAVQLGFALTGLLPGTTYHYRIVALNEDGTTFGPDQTFTTGSFPPVIISPGPVQIVPTPVEVKPPPPPPVETLKQQYNKAVKLCNKKPRKKRGSCIQRAKIKYHQGAKKKGKKRK